MNRKIILAGAQLGPVQRSDSRRHVVERLISLVEDAAEKGARWVVFPELSLTTFFPRYWLDDDAEIDRFFETEMPSPTTSALFKRARELEVGFYLGYAELVQEAGHKRRFNTAILVDPMGRQIGKYRKVHLPGHLDYLPTAPFQHLEKRYFDVGDLGFPVWNTVDAKIGMCICNDRRWPETFRVMGLQGVEIVMLGYNTPSYNIYHEEQPHLRMFHNRLSVQAAAYQNACWIIAVAKAGCEDGHALIGGSCIVAPTGEIAAQAMTEKDELIVFEADLELSSYIRNTVFDFARHRRPEHYGLIVERRGAGALLGKLES